MLLAGVDDDGAHAARLRDETQVGQRRTHRHEAGDEQVALVGHEADAVGSDERHAGLAGDAHEVALDGGALLAGLGEAGGDHDHGAGTASRARIEHALHHAAADDHEHEVGLFGQVVDARIRLQAEQLGGARVHGVHVTLEAPVEQVAQGGATPLVQVV